jgi:DNA-binding HxlR family transcriptional regulator
VKNIECTLKAIEAIGTRHRLEVICHLLEGKIGFNELKRKLSGMSSTTLSRTLKFLESKKLVDRKVVSQKPLAVEYSVTKKGQELSFVMDCLGNWVQEQPLIKAKNKTTHEKRGFNWCNYFVSFPLRLPFGERFQQHH